VRRAALQLIALLPIPVILGLVHWAGRRPPLPQPAARAARAAGRDAAAVPLPARAKSGWEIFGKPQRFDERTLFDRIDGAAPPYISAGFKQSWGAEYRQAGRAEPVTVDVYDMGSAAQAFGMYAIERDAKYRFIEVGDAGYLASGSLNFWRGRFYVKLAGFEEGEAMDRALQTLAQDLVAALPADPAAPRVRALVGALPPEGRQPHSEGYARAPLDGIAGASLVYYASYAQPGLAGRYRVFVVAPDAGGIAERLTRMKRHWEGAGAKVLAEARSVALPGAPALSCQLVQAEQQATASFALRCAGALGGALDVPRAALAQVIRQLARALGGVAHAR
jgi:hypothetical protein